MNKLHFNVSHYGEIIKDYEYNKNGIYTRQKIYNYENKLYIEIKQNGEIILFKKLSGT